MVDDDVTGAQIFADEARDEDKTRGMYEVNKISWQRGELCNFSQTLSPGWCYFIYLLKRKET